MSDTDDISLRTLKQVWNGEDFFSPDLFRYFTDDFYGPFKRRSNTM